MTPSILAGLIVAGAVGAPARSLLDGLVQDRNDGVFPWGTFIVNISGSLLLGLIAGVALYHAFPATPAIWLGSGFCGAYATFSTFTSKPLRLLEEGALAGALRHAVASLLTGTAAAAAGLALAAAF
ncbi:MAG: CrcB family protein [Planctomycetia bacterium]|nr:CrcB family protein [Planctomycetia bacterium]